LGGILKRKNDLDAAIAAYKKAALIKRSSYPYNNLGMLYMQKNDLAHMRENFGLVELFAQARVNRDAGDEWAHNDLFMAQIVMDKVADAQTSLTRIKVVAPSYAIESLLRSLDSLAKVQGLPPATLNFVQQAIQELTAHLDYLSSGD
jgi:tetratricopeptide (TPR) repeat protein